MGSVLKTGVTGSDLKMRGTGPGFKTGWGRGRWVSRGSWLENLVCRWSCSKNRVCRGSWFEDWWCRGSWFEIGIIIVLIMNDAFKWSLSAYFIDLLSDFVVQSSVRTLEFYKAWIIKICSYCIVGLLYCSCVDKNPLIGTTCLSIYLWNLYSAPSR